MITEESIRDLVLGLKDVVHKLDGLCCHFSAIDADYGRVRNTLFDHEDRLRKLEANMGFEPNEKPDIGSALYPADKVK
jgi:hypothetical protein